MRRGILSAIACFVALAAMIASAQAADPRAWSIVATYDIPNSASGLAWDGTNLYCGIYGTNGGQIYRINPETGAYALLCTGPQDDAYGLTWDGSNFWTTHHPSNPAVALQLNTSCVSSSQFNLPAQYISGIAYDNGDFWVARYYPDPGVIYKVNSSGTILRQFNAPDNQPWDLCLENGYLWMADYWGDKLYRIDTLTGVAVESHASQGVDPAGIVWDGQYLWYCDEGAGSYDRLYKIDLSGAGTPVIYLPANSHDYGIVTVGDTSTWNMAVYNNGTANLVVTGVSFGGASEVFCSAAFPDTIVPGGETPIPISYAPTTIGTLSETAIVASNDPVHPTVNVTLTGDAVNPGPDIYLPAGSHDYGTVRAGAYTRWIMVVQNTGDASLSISGMSSSDIHFSIDDSVVFPFALAPLASVNIGVWFYPKTNQSYQATLSISSNDPDENPYDVTLQGIGLKEDHPIGDTLWEYYVTGSWDNSPKAIAPIPDINGDGIADVIICSEDDYVRAINGNAHGTGDVLWQHYIYGGSIYNQNSLAINEDVNGDGYSDVVVGSAWGGRLIRTISGGTGAEIWTHDTHEYGGGGWVYQVDCSHDYNGDGISDVLAATGNDADNTGPKRVYCLNGITGVSIWECYLDGPVFGVIGVEDFTGDGEPDAVAGASTVDETSGRVYGINGVTRGVEWTFVTSGTSVWALQQVDDINGDGTKDIAAGDFSYSTGYLYGLNATNGGVLYGQSGFGSITRLEKLDDVNADGHPDLIAGHFGTSAIVIDGQTGAVIWSHPLADKSSCVARANDFNGDAVSDVFVGTLYTNNYLYCLDGKTGSEVYVAPISSAVDALSGVPDIVGDNSMEAVVGGRNGAIYCLSGGINSLVNHAPNVPANPVPGDGETGVAVGQVLSWTGGDPDPGNVVKYDVYFGASSPPPLVSTQQSGESYDPPGDLQFTKQYFWRIISRDQLGATTTGPLWRFTTAVPYICGDADASGNVDISDAVYLIAYIFAGGPAPVPIAAGDANCDEIADISDAVYLIAYIFTGGPAPCAEC